MHICVHACMHLCISVSVISMGSQTLILLGTLSVLCMLKNWANGLTHAKHRLSYIASLTIFTEHQIHSTSYFFFEKESHNAAQDGLNSSTSAAQVPKLQACTTIPSFMYLCYFLKTEFQVIQTGPKLTAKDDLELLTFLLPPPKCIDGHHSWLYVLLGLTPRTSSRLGRHYINWGTPPGLSLLLIDFPWLPWVIVFSQGVLSLLSGNGYRKNRDLGSPRCVLW